MDNKIKIADGVKELCNTHNIPYDDVSNALEDALSCFISVIYIDVKPEDSKISVEVSTEMDDFLAFKAKEKCLDVWSKNLNNRTLDFIELYCVSYE